MEKNILVDFHPGDVLVERNECTGLIRRLKDWLLGSEWGHVALFYDSTKRGLPLLVESIGRGVMIRSALATEGRYVAVLRCKDPMIALFAARKAERLADNPGSWYDYWAIPRYVLPRLIWYKLTGRRYGFGWRQNPYFICSELVDAAYNGAVSADLGAPLPGDFMKCKGFDKVAEGILTFTETLKKRRE